ncbi:DUF3014 domain-containing protein [Catenovulum sp. 2E275]|uniref:DUF3014 domain-containing protein n=1 Tax=Catenovulum sp. 2E275 TaxID=2980497 RepID=UPI0021D20446|nr:DUF3014 domain-containing protein [Catenovulum sp. 2E275]MCU4677159.1 DUF3014 domain-containing protein [Catenovulum sp. 2E275]
MAEQNSSKIGLYTGVAAAVILGIGAIYFLSSDNEEPTPQPMPVTTPPQVIEPEPVEEPKLPEETQTELTEQAEMPQITEPQKPAKPELPALNQSDDLVKTDIEQAYQQPQIESLFVDDDLIRKFVVFVDNAAQGSLAQQHSPVNKPKSDFKVIPADNNEYILDPQSYKRYDAYVSMFTMLNADTLIDYFKKFRPLINQAYAEIGYQDGKFEQSMIEAIDLALATPLVENEIRLVAPSAMYKFADPELESLKPIQKLLIRMGPKNQLKVQAALEKVRKQLVK